MADISDTRCRNCGNMAMNKKDDGHVYCAWCDRDVCGLVSLLRPNFIEHKEPHSKPEA